MGSRRGRRGKKARAKAADVARGAAGAPDAGGEGGGRAARGRGGKRARVETSAGGVVFRRTDEGARVLLIRDPYQNWGLPKGHIEDGESTLEAALREVSEETGLDDLQGVSELPTIDWYFRDRGRLVHKFCHFFLIRSEEGDPCPQEEEGISACQWLPVAEAIRTVTYENAREVLRAAGEQLRSLTPPAG